MLKACPYCGGIHETGQVCPKKPGGRKYDRAASFRSTKQWQRKRERIRQRDGCMCRLCAIGYGGERVRYNPNVSVHHIEPIAEAWDKRLDDSNLICLCPYHHELAERGEIDRNLLKKLAISQIFPPSRAK